MASKAPAKTASGADKTGRTGGTGRKAGKGGKARRVPARELPEPGWRGIAILLVVAVVLYAMVLRGERILVTAADTPSIAAIQVALFLSSILLAALLLGMVAGVGAVRLLAGRDGTALVAAKGRRRLLALAGGLVAGLIAGGAAALLQSGLRTSDALTVGGCIALAALIGGGAAAIRPGVMVVAGSIGTAVMMVLVAIRSLFISPLTRLFGATNTVQGWADATTNLVITTSIVAGVLAGVAAHWYVRRNGNTLGTAANLLAGGTAGILSLLAQLVTWVGATGLVVRAGGLDLGDQFAFSVAGSYQVVGSAGLFFAGALVATVLYGRTVPSRRRTPAKKSTAKPEWAVREERKAAEIERKKSQSSTS